MYLIISVLVDLPKRKNKTLWHDMNPVVDTWWLSKQERLQISNRTAEFSCIWTGTFYLTLLCSGISRADRADSKKYVEQSHNTITASWQKEGEKKQVTQPKVMHVAYMFSINCKKSDTWKMCMFSRISVGFLQLLVHWWLWIAPIYECESKGCMCDGLV